jgi:hypothetical protein
MTRGLSRIDGLVATNRIGRKRSISSPKFDSIRDSHNAIRYNLDDLGSVVGSSSLTSGQGRRESASMLFRFQGRCRKCSHQWDGLRRRIACGRIDFFEPDTCWRYSCTRCFVELCVPRQLSRCAWLHWVSQNASELTRSPLHFTACELGVRVDLQSLDVISRSPLLFRVCERISSALAGTRSRYLPVAIDVGTIECPDCGDSMTRGYQVARCLTCPQCKNLSAESMSEQHAGIVLVDYSSLDLEDVRRVIVHLERLAEPREDDDSKRMLALPAFEGMGTLWDRQLDG